MGNDINGNAGPQGYAGHRYSHKQPSEARIKKLIKKKEDKKNQKKQCKNGLA